jgi:hypothetical protein
MSNPETNIFDAMKAPVALGIGELVVGAVTDLSGRSGLESISHLFDAAGLITLTAAGLLAGFLKYFQNRYPNNQNTKNQTNQTD